MKARMMVIAVLTLVVASGTTYAAGQESKRAKKTGVPLTVAVLDFETKGKTVADLGEKIGDLLTVFLSTQEGLQPVERDRLKTVLQELELGVSGIVSPDKATRIGGLVGAQVLVTGRAFVINEKLYVVARAISVETSRVNATLATGALSEDLDAIVKTLSGEMATWLRKNADKMVAEIRTPQDKVKALRKAIAGKGKRLPAVAVKIIETHRGGVTVDPAAETELIYLLRKVGIPVFSGKELKLSDWAKDYLLHAKMPLPVAAAKADVIIVGEGFSEYAGRRGGLISVKARLELKAIDRKTGKVIGIGRTTVTHVDLAEQIAGKTALQMASGQVAVEMLPDVVKEWRALRTREARKEKD